MKAAVLGAGSWGTTFAQVLSDAGTRTVLYARKPQLAKALAGPHENPDYLPGIALTPALDATSDPAEALDGATWSPSPCPRRRCAPTWRTGRR